MGQAFFLFALILLPSLIFLGLVTFVRVNQTGIEDMIAARSINRIRHYYTEVAPLAKTYFMLSTNDDMIVSVINSILTAVFVGLMIFVLFNTLLVVCIAAGGVIFAASVALYMRYQHQYWEKNEQHMQVLFPSENEGQH